MRKATNQCDAQTIFLCGPAFSRSVWWWRFGGGWLCFRGVSNVRWCGTWCHVVGCEVRWSNVVGCEVTWGELMSKCHVVSCDVMWCHVMSFDVIWCDVFLRCVMSCDVTRWYVEHALMRCKMGRYALVMRCGWLWNHVVWFEVVVMWSSGRCCAVNYGEPLSQHQDPVLQSTTPFFKVLLRTTK